MVYRESVEFGGRTLTIETGRIAKQSGGAAWMEYGDSRVLVAANGSGKAREGIDFFPLTVDYQEKMSAVGRFPGGYIKRESRPQLRETLTSRMIDRPIRPLFPSNYNHETQIVATVFSADLVNDTDVMAMIGASAAITLSSLPFDGPIGGVRIGLIDGEFVCNPAVADMENSRCDIFLAASEKAIVMVEGICEELSEDEMVTALMKGFEWIQPVIELQKRLQALAGKPKLELPPVEINEEVKAKVAELALPGLKEAYQIADKMDRYAAVKVAKTAVKEALADLPDEEKGLISGYFGDIKHDYVRSIYLEEGRRIGDREYDKVREITCETGLLPRVHGSALFTRGETQSLVSCTLGTNMDNQRMDDILGDRYKNFLLHYNFPPYSVGECKRMGSPNRRELGHGNLAERALLKQVPVQTDDFPYVVRVLSEIMESNGSSSMASVCGGCLAMMDAGVPIEKPVAGIAMGMIEGEDKSIILSDILGDEDHLGDMDFKVCGTAGGITAIQMDLKVKGIDEETLSKALYQAKEGRAYILGKMLEHLPESRKEMSPYAPQIITMKISPDRIRDVIGAGGKTIREIVEQTNCKINVDDDGTVTIAAVAKEDSDRAVEIIEGLTEEPEVGKTYHGKVKRITDFGAFVEIIPGVEGLLHISEVAWERINSMEDHMKEGDMVDVKMLEMERNGKYRLSMKALKPKPEGYVEPTRRPRPSGGRPGGRPGGDRGRGGPRR